MIREAGLGQYDPVSIRVRQVCQLICPRRCPFCGRVLGFVPRCPDCEGELDKLRRKTCSNPRPHEGMASCAPVWAAAPFWYQGMIRQSLLWTKYQGKPWISVQLGCLLARELFGVKIRLEAGVEVPQPLAEPVIDCDLIAPVPSSGRGRPYNVPELMARPLARGLGIPLEPKALRRRSPGRPQASLSRRERLVSVAGQFEADADAVAGRRVLLIDDVVTTGATAAACTRALLAAGAESVAFVALAAPQGLFTLPAAAGIPFAEEEEDRPADEEDECLDF